MKNVLSRYVYYHIIFYIAAGMEDSQEDNECLFIFFLDSSMATRGSTICNSINMFRSWKNVADHPQISLLSPPRLDSAGGSYLFFVW